MAHITKIAAVETTTAIWEYNPSLSDNRVLNGSLDVITTIQTLAIKVCLIFELYILIPSSLTTDSGIGSVNWSLWKASDWVRYHGSSEDSPSQQCLMGNCIQYAQ
jgi:hypothetical protein